MSKPETSATLDIPEILNNDELSAAKVLYEMANGLDSSVTVAYNSEPETDKLLGKRKVSEDDSKSESHKKVRPHRAIYCANDRATSSSSSMIESNPQESPNQIPSKLPFSVIHFLSAVRAALVTPLLGYYGPVDRLRLPFLNIHRIEQRVRSNPGDPSILECEEALLELVKGALKIFSSEKPDFGATTSAPLTLYDESRKGWRWVGPLPFRHENCAEVKISDEAWGLSQENLIKLANRFHIWLSKVQPTLRLVATLPEPPLHLMQERDSNSRFNNRKKLNSCTIGERCDEVKAYFRKEETIRYLVSDRGFCYTALDGKKSAVAPLRKSSDNKSFPRSRGHYMIKASRPPHFSLLSLVRDAAARLPGGIGTRADICSLIRDSQHIVGGVEAETVKLLVSSALARLQREVDPCVVYNRHSGLWTYLHRDRDQDDFNANGTSQGE